MVKLNIELTMADLIAKIACSPHRDGLFLYDDVTAYTHPSHRLASSWCPDRKSHHSGDKQTSQNIHHHISGIDRDLTGLSSILHYAVSDFTEKVPQAIVSSPQNNDLESAPQDVEVNPCQVSRQHEIKSTTSLPLKLENCP